jgi:hypothetical protein
MKMSVAHDTAKIVLMTSHQIFDDAYPKISPTYDLYVPQ